MVYLKGAAPCARVLDKGWNISWRPLDVYALEVDAVDAPYQEIMSDNHLFPHGMAWLDLLSWLKAKISERVNSRAGKTSRVLTNLVPESGKRDKLKRPVSPWLVDGVPRMSHRPRWPWIVFHGLAERNSGWYF